jgi:membrane fusion protein, multidrug efflux system
MVRLTHSAVLAVLLSGAAVLAETPAVPPLAVEVVEAHADTQTREYSLTGELRARDSVGAAFPIAGRIVEILVEQGQTVTAGTVLARMDAVQQQQALRSAEAGLNTAEADNRQAAEDMRRAETLFARGATTRAARDTAEDKLQITAGALAQAEADLDRARKALSDTELTAPADATVTDRMAEAGQVVGAAQPVLDLALAGGMEAVFEVPEVLLTKGSRPMLLRLSRLSDPDVAFDGIIREVSPLVDATTGTVAVTVRIPEPPPGMSFGEAVRGTATIAEPAKIVLPYTALSATTDGPAVWLVDAASGAVSLRQVAVERYETGRIVLASGLEDGDRVVARGAQLLYPGRVVRAVEVAQ